MDNLEVLKAIAQQVRNATEIGENTAERIGRFLVGIIEWIKTENFDEKYLRKDVEEWAQQLIHFMNGIDVKNHAVFNDTLSSEDFASGFTSGKGWSIWLKNIINAAGANEKLACMELDELTIRKTLKVFEFIISQMRGENDNVTFSGFMKVDHYDADTGRIYLKTDDGQLYNPFRVDDYLYCQQFNGMPSEDNDYTVIKTYEFIVTDAQVGSLEDKDKRLDWITLKNFNGDFSLIKENDVLVRLDNLSNPDRKGIIQMMTVGNSTPYMDILYGAKTDPDNALKSRFGNLQGIYSHLFGWLQAFGAYIINLYAVGDFRIRQTGEDTDTKIEILKSMFQTYYQKLTYDLTEEDNYLKNATFTENLEGWISDDDVKFITLNDDVLFLNRSTVVSKDRMASIEEYDGKNVLHLSNGYVRQLNTNIRKPGTHKEYNTLAADGISEAYMEVKDTLYLSLKFFCKRSGTLTIGFEGSATTEKSLPFTVMQVASSTDWLTYKWSGDWDGKGDFVLKFTGDMYVSLLALTDNPLNDYKKEVSTSIQQTASNIRLLGTNINNLKGTVTNLGIDLDAAKERITLYANKVDNMEGTVTSLGIRLDAAESNITLYATKVGNNETAISALQVRADSISSAVTSVEGDLETAKARIEAVKAIADAAGDAETYTQPGNPWGSWSGGTEHKHVGAVWHNTSDGHTYRYIGYDNTNSWEDVTNNQSSASYVLQNKDKISAVVGSFDAAGNLTNTSGLVTTAYATSIYATKNTVDSLTGRVTAAEASINVHSSQISMRVEKDGVISEINQTAESVTIDASKINFNGVTTINNSFRVERDGTTHIGRFVVRDGGLTTEDGSGSITIDDGYDGMLITGDIHHHEVVTFYGHSMHIGDALGFTALATVVVKGSYAYYYPRGYNRVLFSSKDKKYKALTSKTGSNETQYYDVPLYFNRPNYDDRYNLVVFSCSSEYRYNIDTNNAGGDMFLLFNANDRNNSIKYFVNGNLVELSGGMCRLLMQAPLAELSPAISNTLLGKGLMKVSEVDNNW